MRSMNFGLGTNGSLLRIIVQQRDDAFVPVHLIDVQLRLLAGWRQVRKKRLAFLTILRLETRNTLIASIHVPNRLDNIGKLLHTGS